MKLITTKQKNKLMDNYQFPLALDKLKKGQILFISKEEYKSWGYASPIHRLLLAHKANEKSRLYGKNITVKAKMDGYVIERGEDAKG
jgi:ATP-dependent RNA circularization protein (DNA/RNA ligase family)